jgi:hypothetical protein
MGHHVPRVGIAAAATGMSGLTFLSVVAKGPGSATRTCLEVHLRIPFFLSEGTGSLAA